MSRDGQTISLWQHEIPSYKTIIKDLPAVTEVVIIGGGITDLSTAFKIQHAGKNCLLIEAQEIGFGTTGGTTAHLNTVLDTPYYQIKNHFGEANAKKVAQLTKNAIDLIDETIHAAEKSWDCPCHGSRFSFTGELLNAPATNNLVRIDLTHLEKAN